MGDPLTMGVSILKWSFMTSMIWGYPNFRKSTYLLLFVHLVQNENPQNGYVNHCCWVDDQFTLRLYLGFHLARAGTHEWRCFRPA